MISEEWRLPAFSGDKFLAHIIFCAKVGLNSHWRDVPQACQNRRMRSHRNTLWTAEGRNMPEVIPGRWSAENIGHSSVYFSASCWRFSPSIICNINESKLIECYLRNNIQVYTYSHTYNTHTHHLVFMIYSAMPLHRRNVFILYKLYVLFDSYPSPKLSPHRRRCIYTFPKKYTHSVWFISVLNYRYTENVLINHLLLVIPMSYPCHYTNLCPHKPHKHAHTHTYSNK